MKVGYVGFKKQIGSRALKRIDHEIMAFAKSVDEGCKEAMRIIIRSR